MWADTFREPVCRDCGEEYDEDGFCACDDAERPEDLVDDRFAFDEEDEWAA